MKAKHWITACAPALANNEASVTDFFGTYPDGRLIQVLQDPSTWYLSAKHHRKSAWTGKSTEQFLDLWCLSTEGMLRNRARYGDRVIIVRFEDLMGETETTMAALARELSLAFDPVLLKPTFNGQPIRTNSSFAVEGPGLLDAPLKRNKMLTRSEQELIKHRCGSTYEKALAASI